MGSNPSQPAIENGNICKIETIENIDKILKNRGLSESTIHTYSCANQKFILYLGEKSVTKSVLEKYYNNNNNKRNNLSLFRIIYPEFSKDLKFPRKQFKPKILPSKEQLKIFYDTLSEDAKIIFSLLAESGLRIGELLNSEINLNQKLIIPNGHSGKTKHSWVSFYQTPIDRVPQAKIDAIGKSFRKSVKITGIKIYPHLLRSIFAREMSRAGVQDRHIDAFCGRTPQSVLAKSYSDFSIDTLKEIYLKANIQIF